MIKLRYAIVLVLAGTALVVFGGRELLSIRDVYQYGDETRARVVERQVEKRTFMRGRRHTLEVIEKTYVPTEPTDTSSADAGHLVNVIVLDGREPIEGRRRDGLVSVFRANSEVHFWATVAGLGLMVLGALAAVVRKPARKPAPAKRHGVFGRKAA